MVKKMVRFDWAMKKPLPPSLAILAVFCYLIVIF